MITDFRPARAGDRLTYSSDAGESRRSGVLSAPAGRGFAIVWDDGRRGWVAAETLERARREAMATDTAARAALSGWRVHRWMA